MRTFVIAEIGVNHNGDLGQALRLIDAAAQAGAQAAKFQTFRADALTTASAESVAYQKQSGAKGQYEMLQALELSEEAHHTIARHCNERGIEFMSTAFDQASLDMLCDLGIRRIKVPSGEVNNIPYLEDCARRGLPVVLSTGMAELEEVRRAVTVIRQTMAGARRSDLVVLHCTTAYPAELDDVNLRAMQTMANELNVPVGYSDHTLGTLVAPIAVALGAEVIEKHLTLDRTMAGPDHAASLEPDELATMIATIDSVERLLGDGIKAPQPVEEEARRLVRRGLKAARDLPAGTVLAAADLAILRPSTGLAPEYYESVQGKRLTVALAAGDPIESSALL